MKNEGGLSQGCSDSRLKAIVGVRTVPIGMTLLHLRTLEGEGDRGGMGRLALTRWAGWPVVQVGRHVKC